MSKRQEANKQRAKKQMKRSDIPIFIGKATSKKSKSHLRSMYPPPLWGSRRGLTRKGQKGKRSKCGNLTSHF